MFANPQVSAEALPRVSNVEWQSLHRRYVTEQQLVRSGVFALFGIGGLAMLFYLRLPAALGTALLVAGIMIGIAYVVWPAIEVPRRGFALREHDMIYRHGVVFRNVTAVPFNRIQHVEVSNGPLDRHFGIGTLKLFTAGGSGGDLSVDGLPIGRAEQLREHILGKTRVAIERD